MHALAASLGDGFVRAVDLLAACTGRVAVSGMGKSGHVGRKLAATLASTGTPSLFVHPAEASHGALGMIVPGDAVVALSNSGETAELADLVAHAHRFGIPLVAVTGAPRSTLAQAATVALVLPRAAEACPMGLAPTTSTTMALALGDALAVALLTRRGFSAAEFRLFHPGGRLGARLRRVRDLMHVGDAVPLASPDLPMDRALLVMTGRGFGCVGIVDEAGPALLSRRTGDLMNPSPRTIAHDALAVDALREMNAPPRPVTSLFALDEKGHPTGILHVHDLLRAGVA